MWTPPAPQSVDHTNKISTVPRELAPLREEPKRNITQTCLGAEGNKEDTSP